MSTQDVTHMLDGTFGEMDEAVCQQLGITSDELVELMLDSGYDKCSRCGMWTESGELVDKDNEEQPCSNCR